MKIAIKLNSQNMFFIVFLACLLHSFWAMSVGWNNALLDQHEFRQTQTAISVYYLLKGGSWLAYETPVLGAPWSIPLEFPLYQWLVAIIVKVFGTPIDQTGRLVSAIFFYLSLIPSYIILGFLNVPKSYRWMFLSLFLVSPLYLFWSRTFMIESMALFFGLAYLTAVGAYFSSKSFTPIAFALSLAGLFGILGVLVKVTTFAGFLLAAGIFVFFNWYKSKKSYLDILYILVIPAIVFVLLPYIAISIWNNFADSQKLLNPIAADFITSKSLIYWNFGTIEQKVSFQLWRDTLRRIFYDLFGTGKLSNKLLLIIFLVLPFFGAKKKLCIASGLVFLSVMLVFTNLHFVHNYYQYANGIFAIAALGFCLLGLLEKRGLWKLLGWGTLVFILVFQTKAYHSVWVDRATNINARTLETAAATQKYTDSNDVILIYGLRWSAAIPYYSQRRALLVPYYNETKIKSAFQKLAEYKLGAMLTCQEAKDNKAYTQQFLTHDYSFQSTPIYTNSLCKIYLPLANQKLN